jgi:neutral ceramidase
MAGRRLRRSIRDLLMERGIEDPEITIAGLANSYTHYVTTIEEYSGQRYEAASTLYGPHTLGAYIQEFKRIVSDLLVGNTSASAKPPEDLSKKQISLIPPVTADLIGLGKKFGSVAIEPKTNYTRGKDTVVASFRSANPRNYQELGKTFLTVEYLHDDSSWETVFNDGDWCTRYYWKSTTDLPGVSFAEISWDIPPETPQGIYRICHYGSRRTLLGDFERTLLHAPDWWTFDGFGSIAIGVAFQFAKASQYFSDLVWMALDGVDRSSTKDFSGCTQGFLVQIDQAL